MHHYTERGTILKEIAEEESTRKDPSLGCETFRSQQRNLQGKQESAREEDNSQVRAMCPKQRGACSQGRGRTTGMGDAKRSSKQTMEMDAGSSFMQCADNLEAGNGE